MKLFSLDLPNFKEKHIKVEKTDDAVWVNAVRKTINKKTKERKVYSAGYVYSDDVIKGKELEYVFQEGQLVVSVK